MSPVKSDRQKLKTYGERLAERTTVSERSLVQSWLVLSPTTRLKFSLALCGFAAAGLVLADYVDRRFPNEREARPPAAPKPA
ncbi:hypothetical protein BD626DRAFT_487133 [Schizophyllum amplum]|uniref:Uncharacterized protein n=1 Tax=Schizophyllum amplum TaxID=97359 RepID=A0A550CN53_9AGAR|nr:hypothetical protein BD626DRAFT_487133 [Auriculariopsis ampla]